MKELKTLLRHIADGIDANRSKVLTEEATKFAFVLPLISALGYDPSNPADVTPEANCDVAKPRGGKVDFLLHAGGQPAIIVECKHLSCQLKQHGAQLRRYFQATSARIAVLTNGVEYRLFADLEKPNIMDDEPFADIYINQVDEAARWLYMLQKEHFDIKHLLGEAAASVVASKVYAAINKEAANPSDQLVRYFGKQIYGAYPTSKQAKLIRAAIKKCLSGHNEEAQTVEIAGHNDNRRQLGDGEDRCELEALLTMAISIDGAPYRVQMTKRKGYTVAWIRHPYWWICRLAVQGSNCKLMTCTQRDKWSRLESIHNIADCSDGLKEAHRKRLDDISDWDNKHKQI